MNRPPHRRQRGQTAVECLGVLFDVVSVRYIAQTKPAGFTLNKKFRDQAKATFEAARRTGRVPYFHFEGPPGPGVLETIERYRARYGLDPVVDLERLG